MNLRGDARFCSTRYIQDGLEVDGPDGDGTVRVLRRQEEEMGCIAVSMSVAYTL